jgi:hypothetical protein
MALRRGTMAAAQDNENQADQTANPRPLNYFEEVEMIIHNEHRRFVRVSAFYGIVQWLAENNNQSSTHPYTGKLRPPHRCCLHRSGCVAIFFVLKIAMAHISIPPVL